MRFALASRDPAAGECANAARAPERRDSGAGNAMIRGTLPALLASLALATASQAREPAPLAAEACVGCHGPGAAGSGSVPGIAGRDAREIATAVRAFRSGERSGTIMGRIARGYTEDEIAAIAAYLARSDR